MTSLRNSKRSNRRRVRQSSSSDSSSSAGRGRAYMGDFGSESKESFAETVPRGPVRREIKYVDNTASLSYVCDTTGFITPINLIAEGDDNTARNGRQVLIKSVELIGQVHPVDSVTADTLCRFMLVWDKQPNGAVAAITDILVAANSCTFYNLDNRDRFSILWDHKCVIGAVQTAATTTYAGSPTVSLIDVHKATNLVTTFKGTTAAIGSIATGSLLLLSIGDQAANNGGVAEISARVRFVDLSGK